MALIDKKSIVKYDDFQKIQILTGTIKSAEINIKARKPAYVLSIDFGPDQNQLIKRMLVFLLLY